MFTIISRKQKEVSGYSFNIPAYLKYSEKKIKITYSGSVI